ncbi:NADPH-dependent FMN reductase [Nocardioides euryhalodurans]|uniref:NADPH-dependent oxidoreductase n=1 Tax=Nocardioides euryhalodurans TaxID=2518370 RepID=A0A4P7GJL9_9ACTN|nr:NAD(P)H-dependent oxidoreductase [Nocardioides euryhalodurans]QBR92210.1 NADPH-dependent oxidoreductase [Nocardioides euryhalodurans]
MSLPPGTVPRTAVVVGNPKPASRTLTAARRVAHGLTGSEQHLEVDLATWGTSLLDPEDAAVDDLVRRVGEAELVVVASPTYKATYTGLLKVFLDRFPAGGLRGVAVPVMLGAGPAHALAPDTTLRPLLAELGAVTPVRGLYVLDRDHDDPAAYDGWLASARPVVASLLDHRPHLTGVPA